MPTLLSNRSKYQQDVEFDDKQLNIVSRQIMIISIIGILEDNDADGADCISKFNTMVIPKLKHIAQNSEKAFKDTRRQTHEEIRKIGIMPQETGQSTCAYELRLPRNSTQRSMATNAGTVFSQSYKTSQEQMYLKPKNRCYCCFDITWIMDYFPSCPWF